MSVLTIPFDFQTRRYPRSLVPICMSDTDADGHRIARQWFEAVIPIAEYLRRLARERIGDVWRVSELAELSVHAQCRTTARSSGESLTGESLRTRAGLRRIFDAARLGLVEVSTSSLAMGTGRSSIRSITRPGSRASTT